MLLEQHLDPMLHATEVNTPIGYTNLLSSSTGGWQILYVENKNN